MKICFLAPANSSHSYKWISFFAQRGYDVIWISLDKKLSTEIPENVTFIELSSSRFLLILIKTIFSVRKILKHHQPDILHVHSVGRYGFVASWLNATPMIVTAWGSDIILNKSSFIKIGLIKRVLEMADVITCDAQHMHQRICRLIKNTDKVKIINFGVDTKKFYPQENTGQAACKKTLVSLRSFEHIYDIPTLIRALPKILDSYPDICLKLIGGGSQRDALAAMIEAFDLEKVVQFTGLMPYDSLPGLIASSDIYVSTSLSDAGIASSTAEAMACGVPVVVSNTGENHLWVKPMETGLLFKAGDSDALAEAVIKLLSDENLTRKIGKAAREEIVNRNDYTNEMLKMNEIYLHLAS